MGLTEHFGLRAQYDPEMNNTMQLPLLSPTSSSSWRRPGCLLMFLVATCLVAFSITHHSDRHLGNSLFALMARPHFMPTTSPLHWTRIPHFAQQVYGPSVIRKRALAEAEAEAEADDEEYDEGEWEDESLEDLPVMSMDQIEAYLAGTTQGSGLMAPQTGRVGYVALLGRPNTGKSTMLNALLGYRLAATSYKPQTTRRQWLGILSDEKSQILFLDTPGVHISNHALGKAMRSSIEKAVKDADVVVILVDPTRAMEEEDEMVATFASQAFKPLILAINKCDVATPLNIQEAENFYRGHLGDKIQEVHKISAVNPITLPPLTDAMRQLLPEGPFLYPADQMTDARERDVAAEIIREILLERLKQEVPHATAVVVEEFKERDEAVFVKAVLHVERETQKPILIGKGGKQIAEIRVAAEQALKKQYLKPTKVSFDVVVSKEWRKDPRKVADFLTGGLGSV